MARKNPKIAFLLSLLILFSSCLDIEPTYQRKNIETAIKNLCKEEYNLKVEVEEAEDTIWIYAPFNNLTDGKGELDKKVTEEIGDIILSLQRVILSIDKPPKFYIFVASDIKNTGADLILIGFVPDLVKLQLRFISRGEFFKRRYLNFRINPQALGDEKGYHIKKFNLDLEDFTALIIGQQIRKFFTSAEYKEYFEVKKVEAGFNSQNKEFTILIDIEKRKYRPYLPKPFEETLKIAQYYICKVYELKNFNSLRIEDLDSGKIKILSKKALQELSFD